MNHTDIISKFDIPGEIVLCEPYGNGHINTTYLVTSSDGKKYILQAINTEVFKNPDGVMENIYNVTSFLKDKVDDSREVMSVIPLREGGLLFEEGKNAWRMLVFVEDSICLEAPESNDDFYECAVAFGTFQRRLGDFDASILHETIPNFHNTVKRYEAFIKAVEEDVCGRAESVRKEIEFIKARKDFCSVLLDANASGKLPLRVTHNDTKINNVLLDKNTRKALCVIDLDTIMPGFSVTDFGDSIRSGAATAAEDEKDLAKVGFDISLYETFARGFILGCGGALGRDEVMLFPEGAKMMTLECGMRFLTDYLSGDTYFKTAYEGHNLDRCRTQLKMVASMEEKWDEMKKIVEKLI